MTIYLSGIHYETDENFIHSLKRQLLNLGCTIVNPDEKLHDRLGWSKSLTHRLGLILESDTIYMLPKWKDSTTARIELTAAMKEKKNLCFSFNDIKNLITTLDG
ncbi:DUF4406 domain-containing protein [Mangrovibacterium diazotrophicum]|uniref:Uncharacterized protein DUF4406 n=1 Tax=Mangrovibacterium diazotrophicum TaxID=1261403 RepID=A0A419W2V7_9BACT|nr:DUF4406 domain-containing protein [Mangrovibacterium diazotrophicum]RKD89817.1 uncharacterized protein DUF4406 [Mangrovibacterium diazotrophicum]